MLAGWILIEVFCYYCMILSTVIFLAANQFRSIFNNSTPKESIRGKTDIIRYSIRTLYWYAFNLCIIAVPCLLISLQYSYCSQTPDANEVYFILVVVLIVNHLVFFIFMRKIMILVPHKVHNFSN